MRVCKYIYIYLGRCTYCIDEPTTATGPVQACIICHAGATLGNFTCHAAIYHGILGKPTAGIRSMCECVCSMCTDECVTL